MKLCRQVLQNFFFFISRPRGPTLIFAVLFVPYLERYSHRPDSFDELVCGWFYGLIVVYPCSVPAKENKNNQIDPTY